jgi:Xaa-Pro aminopeptidase
MQPDAHTYEIPMLSEAERDGRWTRVREQMARAGLDCLLAYSGPSSLSALYLTQIDMEGLAVFPLERDPIFLLPSGERWLHWAQRSQTWVQDVRPVRDLAAATAQTVESLAPRRVGLVELKETGRGQHLADAINEFDSSDASDLVYALRMVKSPEELAMMEQAARIADRTIQVLRERTRSGIREHELYAEMYGTLLAGGCEPASGISMETTAEPFHPVRKPSTRTISQGDVVMAHINPRYSGYFGHPHVCLTVGEPQPRVKAMFQVAEEAYETFKANARPGVSLGDVCRKTLDVIERHGYDWQKEPLCHSIGLAQNEPPNGGIPSNPYPALELVENQTFGLHPWVGRMAESIGIDSGRAVRITKDGAVPFGGLPSIELYSVPA